MHSSRGSLAVVGILFVLLVTLAGLQYRWIAQLSEAEQARMQETLDRTAASFCEDFDREIARAFALFRRQPNNNEDLSRLLADGLDEWRSESRWPELVNGLFVVRSHEPNEVELLQFDETSLALVERDWSGDLDPIRHILREPGPGVPVIDGALPGLVLPIQEHGPPEREAPMQWRPPRDHLVVRLDLSVMAETVFPRLAETHFGFIGDHPYLLSISSRDRPGKLIYRSDSEAPPRAQTADATAALFGLRSFTDFSPPSRGGFSPGGPPPPGREHSAADGPRGPPPPRMRARSEEGRWRLAVHHPKGSLEHVVASARKRNMAISLVTLAMLGATTVLLLLSTRNARRLARRQMDFVASVSHELRTPLTAIRSAGQNLADGIIDDPERVRSYGLLIEREGRRLTEMIGRVLTFAGIRSGRQINRMKPVAVAEIVKASLEDCAWVLEEKGFEVRTEIADDLPQVLGDTAALQQVFTNLIDNATKYASGGAWLGIEVVFEPTPDQGELHISISDRGPGIPKSELTSIFEPFQRGIDTTGSSIPGSGLGLSVVRSIVQAHRGGISVDSPPAGGARFTVRLPVTTDGAIAGESQ